jgi:DnaJ-class molecular chaperone
VSCTELRAAAQPDTLPGDVILVLQQKEHATFKRKGNDLFVEKEISLTEALCGYQFVVEHLDGRQVQTVPQSSLTDRNERSS